MKKRIIVGVMMVCMLALAGCGENGTSADSNTIGNAGGKQTAEAVDSSETENTGNNDTTTMDMQEADCPDLTESFPARVQTVRLERDLP